MATLSAVTSPHTERLLGVHVCQGQTNNCGPFSASFVINAFTPTPVDPPSLARELDRPAWAGFLPIIRRIPNSATFPWGVADILRRNGVHAVWTLFFTPAKLIRALQSGQIPILFLGTWRPFWGHVMVLAAWDPAKGWGFVDPALNEPSLHWFEAGQMARLWSTYARSVVIADGDSG
jgi:hypothetical protein